MDKSKIRIKNEEDYKKALELYRFLWLNAVDFSTIKAKAALMEIIEEYERRAMKNKIN